MLLGYNSIAIKV